MPNENKLYLCFEYCEFDLKKYMKSQSYKLSAECIKVRARCFDICLPLGFTRSCDKFKRAARMSQICNSRKTQPIGMLYILGEPIYARGPVPDLKRYRNKGGQEIT